MIAIRPGQVWRTIQQSDRDVPLELEVVEVDRQWCDVRLRDLEDATAPVRKEMWTADELRGRATLARDAAVRQLRVRFVPGQTWEIPRGDHPDDPLVLDVIGVDGPLVEVNTYLRSDRKATWRHKWEHRTNVAGIGKLVAGPKRSAHVGAKAAKRESVDFKTIARGVSHALRDGVVIGTVRRSEPVLHSRARWEASTDGAALSDGDALAIRRHLTRSKTTRRAAGEQLMAAYQATGVPLPKS